MFSFFIFNKLAKNSFHFVIMGFCVYNVEENNEFNPFWNKAVTQQNVEKMKHWILSGCTVCAHLKFSDIRDFCRPLGVTEIKAFSIIEFK